MGLPHPLLSLRQIRRVRNVDVATMAETIGVQPTSYSRFEAGTRRIYLDKAILLAKRLGVRIDDLGLLMDEDTAARLCDQRDKEAIATGTFDHTLWTMKGSHRAQIVSETPLPSAPPPPPAQLDTVVNLTPGTVFDQPIDDNAATAAMLEAWDAQP